MTHPRTISLTEYKQVALPADQLSQQEASRLHDEFGTQVSVDPPSFKTGDRWLLSSQGWVGTVPVNEDLLLVLEPKVPIANLFRMLEYAYDLKSFRLFDGMVACESLQDVYDRLANILARRVLDRTRSGLYREYVGHSGSLGYVRGSLDFRRMASRPWSTSLPCVWQEHDADVADNQILAWALYLIARGGWTRPETIRNVRAAFRAVGGAVTLRSISPRECANRIYNRLNKDYEPLHALCRFFLEQSGPGVSPGDRKMLPFLVDTARLYESFVGAWLAEYIERHCSEYRLYAQRRLDLNDTSSLRIDIDIVIYRADTQEVVWVLDTKYKARESPAAADLQQVVAYASACRSSLAGLIYPVALAAPFDGTYGASDIHVRTLHFALDGDLQAAGERLVYEMGL